MKKVSVVCPYYNESAIIENAVDRMSGILREFGREARLDWELILVDDGSTDNGPSLLAAVVRDEPRVRLTGYPKNQGRGRALRTGIDEAEGDIIITTEIDLSWGEDIVPRIAKAFMEKPWIDAVFASPNLPDGGYKNVPARRVLVSRVGNRILRLVISRQITMNTGMTRGYRRAVIQQLPTEEKGKEFHLEVALKLVMLGYEIDEVPAVLEWMDHKLARLGAAKRKSSSKIPKLVITHLSFAVFANPIRYFWLISLLCFLGAAGCLGLATYRLLIGLVAVYFAFTGLFLAVFGLLFFGFGIVTSQNNRILRELWKLPRRPQ